MANVEALSNVSEFYRGKTVFVTGGTGFMGKVLLEKLLRSCSGVKRVYLLIREKKGKQPQERLDEIFESKLFDRLKAVQPEFGQKITCVSGDLESENLGIACQEYGFLCEEVSVIFHFGATVKFNENLKSIVKRNVGGTKHLIDLARKMDNLQGFVYVSSAYCNTHHEDIYEIVYPTDFRAKDIVQCLSWMNEETIEAIRPKLLSRHPNNYCYSKCLTEQLLAEEAKGLPVVIVRPTNVSSTFREPVEGWIDTYNGTTLCYIAFCKGLGRVLYNPSRKMDFIPVDICINLILASVWGLSQVNGHKSLVVYHCSTCTTNAAYSKERVEHFGKLPIVYPTVKAYRYPRLKVSSNKIIHAINNLVSHILPAVLLDATLLITGKKPWVVSQYKKLLFLERSMRYFYSNSWNFHSKNSERLLKLMSDEDKKIFDFDTRNIDWDKFMNNFALNAREYLLKEDPSTLPLAKEHLRRLYQREMILRVVAAGMIIYLFPYKSWYVIVSWCRSFLSMVFQLSTSLFSRIL